MAWPISVRNQPFNAVKLSDSPEILNEWGVDIVLSQAQETEKKEENRKRWVVEGNPLSNRLKVKIF